MMVPEWVLVTIGLVLLSVVWRLLRPTPKSLLDQSKAAYEAAALPHWTDRYPRLDWIDRTLAFFIPAVYMRRVNRQCVRDESRRLARERRHEIDTSNSMHQYAIPIDAAPLFDKARPKPNVDDYVVDASTGERFKVTAVGQHRSHPKLEPLDSVATGAVIGTVAELLQTTLADDPAPNGDNDEPQYDNNWIAPATIEREFQCTPLTDPGTVADDNDPSGDS